MGKKKGFGRGDAQAALQQQVTRQQIAALRPFVAEQVAVVAQQMQQRLAQQQLSYTADTTLRLRVLEDIVCEKLDYSKDQLSELAMDHEDKVLNLQKVNRAAQKGDYLRVELFSKPTEVPEGQEAVEYEENGQLFIVKNLMEENTKHIYNQVVLSEALVGMTAGEEKEETLEEFKVAIKLRVSRVSEPLKKEESKDA